MIVFERAFKSATARIFNAESLWAQKTYVHLNIRTIQHTRKYICTRKLFNLRESPGRVYGYWWAHKF